MGFWRKVLNKVKHGLLAPRARLLERKLAAVRSEKEALLTELSGAGSELDRIRHTEREQLQALEQRLGAFETERESTRRELHSLQHSLTETVTRLEDAEAQVTRLDARLEQERRKHQGEMQEARERALRQERRLTRVLMLAGMALLLGVVSGVTKIWDTQHNARVLAGLGSDLKDIKTSMEQQLGSMRQLLEKYQPSLLNEPAVSQTEEPQSAVTAKTGEAPARQYAETTVTMPTYGFHPHNKYRTRSEMRAFFKDNARDLGVITLDSGLQYKVLSHGNGRSPRPTDRVVFEYRTYLADGTELYSSYREAEPSAYTVDEVIPGLREALLRMNEGAEWELYIPPKLAHKGVRRRGRGEHAFEPIIYVVELKSVVQGGPSIED